MAASRLLRMCWSSRGCRASSLHLSLLRQKSENMTIEDIHLALAPNQRVLLGSCARSSAVSVPGVGGLLQ